MVLDFQYYRTGLPGFQFVVKEAVRLAFWQVLIVLIAAVGRLVLDVPELVWVLVWLVTELIGVWWAYRMCSRRPGGRKRLLSLPGGPAFAALSSKLGRELRTVWLGEDAKCHGTLVAHPFSTAECPLAHDKDCWQCLYILQVEMTLKEGNTPVAATTNLFSECCCGCTSWEQKYGQGSSELPSEQEHLEVQLPNGWGTGFFDAEFNDLEGCSRVAAVHPCTEEPLGVGCRWERQYLDSLHQKVFVVAEPPSMWALNSNLQASILLLSVADVLSLGLGFAGSMALALILGEEPERKSRLMLAAFLSFLELIVVMPMLLSCVFWKELAGRLWGQMRPLVHHPRYLARGTLLSTSESESESDGLLSGSDSDSD
mmetsp:Transcript_124706/g.364232  ORF Transcript_124706/g.364232 Transcript_124706/m.364232 type:complete len:370 (-) Transcript_124706:23-1132(-)